MNTNIDLSCSLLDSTVNDISVSRSALQSHIERSRNVVSSRYASLMHKAAFTIASICRPEVIYRRYPVFTGPDWIEIACKRFFTEKISSALRGCDETVVFAFTLGRAPDIAIERQKKCSQQSAYALDCASMYAVELGIDIFKSKLEHSLPVGRACTRHMCPGHCDWNFSDQPALFSLLQPWRIGVSLTSASFMVPQKTILGICGIGPEYDVHCYGNPCKYCENISCSHRKK